MKLVKLCVELTGSWTTGGLSPAAGRRDWQPDGSWRMMSSDSTLAETNARPGGGSAAKHQPSVLRGPAAVMSPPLCSGGGARPSDERDSVMSARGRAGEDRAELVRTDGDKRLRLSSHTVKPRYPSETSTFWGFWSRLERFQLSNPEQLNYLRNWGFFLSEF